MKRFLFAALICLALALPAMAETRILSVSWTADGAGAVADVAIPSDDLAMGGWFLYAIETNPGATAPTDNYDVTLEDIDALDVLGGAGIDRDTANSEIAMPTLSAMPTMAPIASGGLTLKVANNAVASAVGVIRLYFVR